MQKLCAILSLSAGGGWRDAPSGEPAIGRFHIGLLALLLLLAACTTPQSQPRTRQPPSPLIYFPIYRQPPSDPVAVCLDYNPQALAFYRLLTGDARQERPQMACHPALVRAAQRRAASLIAGGYWAHCDPNGVCANQVARNMGCNLPADYGNGNNIESLVAGSPDAGVMFAALAASPSHADHLFGRGWFRSQRHAGIAYVPAPRWYWPKSYRTIAKPRALTLLGFFQSRIAKKKCSVPFHTALLRHYAFSGSLVFLPVALRTALSRRVYTLTYSHG